MEKENNQSKIKKTTKNLAIWTLLWLVSFALATFGPKFIWKENTTLSILVIALNIAVGTAMILANIKHLSTLDELQKKIQLEAMGIALGIGIFGGLSYSLLDITNIISTDAEIGYLVMLISISYVAALLIGKKRYS